MSEEMREQIDNFRQWNEKQLNDIKTTEEIINLVYDIHRDPNDFYDDDDFVGLQTILQKYDKYRLEELKINEIGEQYKNFKKKHVLKIMKEIENNPNYPPIIYDKDINLIIDGIHRFEALKRLNFKTIKAYVGI